MYTSATRSIPLLNQLLKLFSQQQHQQSPSPQRVFSDLLLCRTTGDNSSSTIESRLSLQYLRFTRYLHLPKMASSNHMPDLTANHPSNAIHRLSDVVPSFHTLALSSAANQAKTEHRRGELLEELVKQKYTGDAVEEHIKYIRDSFSGFNKRISELHKGAKITSKRWGKDLATEDDADIDEDDEMEDEVDDDDKDGDYNGDRGISKPLTAEQEEEDEEHWRQTVAAIPKDTTITNYYVEMGYQMAPSPPKEEPEIQNQPVSRSERSTQRNSRRNASAKPWIPSLPKNKKRLASPLPIIESPAINVPLDSIEVTDKMDGLVSTADPSSLMPAAPKRAKVTSSSVSLPRFGPKRSPRCSSCMRMKKQCDRKSPCGRCAGMPGGRECTPYWRDV